jgi:ABC-type molybdenum transport system ATPase subunit/photorepair protein PhrA
VTAVLTPDLLPDEALNALDRCDRCGAQAYVRVILASGGELLFCAHHAKKYEEGLRSIAAEFRDETAKLIETTAATASDAR